MLGTVSGLAREPFLEGEERPDLDLPRVVCEYVDVDRTRPGYPLRVPRVVPPSGVPLYNP